MLKKLGILLTISSFAVGCSLAPPAEDAVASHREAIWNATSDNVAVVTPYTNAIVRIDGAVTCSGFYVTSTLIVTASHCISGQGSDYGGPSDLGIKPGDTVHLGPDSDNWTAATDRLVVSVEPMVNHEVTQADIPNDIALIEATPPVVDIAYPQKPRFIVPPLNSGTRSTPAKSAAISRSPGFALRRRFLPFRSTSHLHRAFSAWS
jgi:hypothetical protein